MPCAPRRPARGGRRGRKATTIGKGQVQANRAVSGQRYQHQLSVAEQVQALRVPEIRPWIELQGLPVDRMAELARQYRWWRRRLQVVETVRTGEHRHARKVDQSGGMLPAHAAQHDAVDRQPIPLQLVAYRLYLASAWIATAVRRPAARRSAAPTRCRTADGYLDVRSGWRCAGSVAEAANRRGAAGSRHSRSAPSSPD